MLARPGCQRMWQKREELFEAGLGAKEVEFNDVGLSIVKFKEVLFLRYSKCRDAGASRSADVCPTPGS